MSKIFKSILRLAPVALPFVAPGIGTALGAGLGLTGSAASTVGSGLIGAGLGAASGGGLKGALLGGATGGIGGALSSGALNGIGLGTAAGTPLSGGLQGPTQGTGLIGSVTRGGSGIGTALRNSVGLGGSGSSGSFGGLGNIASGVNTFLSQGKAEDELLRAQGRASEALSPFSQAGAGAVGQLSSRLSSGFNPGDLTQDPGYQFRLREGQQALERSLAARGLSQSGAALKAAQEYGQGLADQTYNDAYSRYLQQNSQLAGLAGTGLGAASGQADIAGNVGNIRANTGLQQSNTITSTLSNALRGGGASQIIGYDNQGNPIYAR